MVRKRSWAIVGAAMLLTAPAALAADGGDTAGDGETYEQLKLFGDVFERVRANYVDEVSDEELVKPAIQGMLSSLDPHSSYLDKDDFEDMKVQTEGEFGGLGIEVTMENGLVKVVSPIDDTPAAEAGLRAGDLIVAIDGDPVMGMTLAEAVERMRGETGTDITLTVRRGEDDPFEVTLTRDVIEIESVRSETFGKVGYLRITTFNEQTEPGVTKHLEEVAEEIGSAPKGYVIDLRNNPGGLLEQAIAVTDTFLDEGEIVSTRGRNEDDNKRYNAEAGDATNGTPLVVLINGGSASAAEIVSGALQDHDRALLLGTRSFGKGSVQTIMPIAGHGAIRLTTARYYTPSGRSIQAEGIEPDLRVRQAKVNPISDEHRREADLRGALDNGEATTGDQDGSEGSGAAGSPKAEQGTDAQKAARLQDDYQLLRAVDLLRGLTLFQDNAARRETE